MSEITKLYENAGVKSFKTCEFCTQRSVDCLKENISNITCGLSSDEYPQFTAEKQIELIKWLLKKDLTDGSIIQYFPRKENYFCLFDWKEGLPESDLFENFEDALACIFNYIWQSLTEEEKQQVKGILE